MASPKRGVTTDFLTPSRNPHDSAFNNTDSASKARADARVIEELRKQAANLVFTQKRAEGYSKERGSQDLVEDVTLLNTDQAQRDAEGYLGTSLFSGKAKTAKQSSDEAYEAATRAFEEADGMSATYQAALIADLFEAHPQLAHLDRSQLTSHPAKKLADLYNKSLNASRIKRGEGVRDWHERNRK